MLEKSVLQKIIPNASDTILLKNSSRQAGREKKRDGIRFVGHGPSRKPKHQRKSAESATPMSRAMQRAHGIPSRRQGS